MEVSVLNINGQETGRKVVLNDAIFGIEPNDHVLYLDVKQYLAIQVSIQVLDNIDTRERETRAFVKLNNFIPNAKCIIITNSEEAVIDCDADRQCNK